MELLFQSKEGTKVFATPNNGEITFKIEGKENKNDLVLLIAKDLRDHRNAEHTFDMQICLSVLLFGEQV